MFGLLPVTYLSIASPHLSVRNLAPSLMKWLKAALPGVSNPSVTDLFLDDDVTSVTTVDDPVLEDDAAPTSNAPHDATATTTTSGGSRLPLLLVMARSSQFLPFLESLRAFQFRVAYVNVDNDVPVPYQTGSLCGHSFAERKTGFSLPSTPGFQFLADYPSIVGIRSSRSSLLDLKEVATYYDRDPDPAMRAALGEMHVNLASLDWRVVEVHLKKCNAHDCIIGNGRLYNQRKGRDCMEHASQFMHSLNSSTVDNDDVV